ncbi:tRNA/rRNA cytosine-C5-methylase [Candidatus Terasakiella magnetica]|uniref:tRNA/rRNA cytosine-C5-methylase n=1 Tax=Candidatus Terasakiella magnetica TaxID=1867952 RepID=A0A1C3RI09_9PROT|nr:RsmB/NOP family class I SAM-dependent RNA methyltransferase [Candidatus Terasakiella magnetica]SCA56908.1 tRNA/rRNA cytosine-C5-methylase [Candidatus Terasakiella magnetica]
MKPAARLQSVIELLEAVFEGKRPADALSTDYFKARRYAGSKDRRFINTRLYETLRNRAKLGWLAEQVSLEATPRTLVLIDAALKEEDVQSLFTGDQYAPEALSAQEIGTLALLSDHDVTNAPDPIRFEYPEWLDKDLRESLGEHFEEVINALNQEAPLDIRINALHPDKAKAVEILKAQNIEAEPTPYSPWGLRSAKKVKLGGIKAYKEGLIDIQDEGSQLISLLTQPKDCELVMDFCAGAGGKTLAMAAEMENKGALYALDISPTRLYKMRPRLERAKVSNVHLHPIKAENDPWLKQFETRLDRVLIDAPCSGVGSWRRAPESRWKMTSELLEDLIGRQERILDSSAHLVRPGGYVVYATCSLLKRENEDQIAKFLTSHDNYTVLPVSEAWADLFDTECPFEGEFMQMRPDLHKSDGFFCAILQRQS